MKIKKIVVFISGNGTNLQALINACEKKEINGQIVLVVANKTEALGLERAKKAGIPTAVKIRTTAEDRKTYDQELAKLIEKENPDWIVLAGWMHVFSNAFLSRFPDKVINLHPALPDHFPGLHAVERAFEAFKKGEIEETGVITHLVPDEGVDNGPLLRQRIVPIHKQDLLGDLLERMHKAEHEIIVATLKQLCE